MKALLFALLLPCFVCAQTEIPEDIQKNTSYKKFLNLKNAGDTKAAYAVGIPLLNAYYHNTDLYFDLGLTLTKIPNNKEKGNRLIQDAYDLEPIYDQLAQTAIAYALFNSDFERVKQLFWEYSFYPRPTSDYEQSITYLSKAIEFNKSRYTTQQYTLARELIEKHKADAAINMMFFWKSINPVFSATLEEVVSKPATFYLELLEQSKPKMKDGSFPTSYYNQILHTLASRIFYNKWEASIVFQTALKEQFNNPKTRPLMRHKLYEILSRINEAQRNYEENFMLARIMLVEHPKHSVSHSSQMLILNNALFSLLQLERYKEALEIANPGLQLLEKTENPTIKLQAYLNLSKAFAYNGDKEKGVALAAEGLQYLKQLGREEDTSLSKPVKENLQALQAFQDKNQLITTAITSNDPQELYDDGIQLMNKKQYAAAIPFFEKALKNYEPVLKQAEGLDRRNKLNLYTKIGANLLGCLFEAKQQAKIFPIMEKIKANGNLMVKKGEEQVEFSLKQIQQTLAADEALVYYCDVMRGNVNDGVFLAAVITRDAVNFKFINTIGALMEVYVQKNENIGAIEKQLAKREFRRADYTQYASLQEAGSSQFKNGELLLLIELYRNYLNPVEGGKVRVEYTDAMYKSHIANAFYIDLVSRLEPWFKDKKRIYISADAALHFLPFESFIDQDGLYLIEKYDIGYISSGSFLKTLRDQSKTNYPKNVLAFGDAHYSKLEVQAQTVKNFADVEKLKLNVEASIKQDEPLDYAFAAFSNEAMNYLKGAKAEVIAIKELVPETDVKMNELMTENEFKRLNSIGALKSYKAIHLSSHAMVHPYIFDLSSIAFSVFPQPVNNQDGMLTVKEMADLDIDTEFMFLSACQTGLGKLVPGEGVQGLNQSMLLAGAKSTLTTLWSVSDYGTMIFTQNLYYKVFREHKDYLTAISELKREFIKGKFDREIPLSQPRFWAPFIYTGK